MSVASESFVHDNEASLRAHIKEKPLNAKTMCKLSSLLHKKYNSNGDSPEERESVFWARRAVSIMPKKPFTHATLSRVTNVYEERIRALENVTEIFDEMYNSRDKNDLIPNVDICVFAVALARLLVEPREMERNKWLEEKPKQNIKRKNPMSKELNYEEKKLYIKTKSALYDAWNITKSKCKEIPSMNSQIYHLALTEYRLGILFRKMEPAKLHQRSSKNHFKQVTNQLGKDHKLAKKARFWLAVIENDHVSEEVSKMQEFDKCPEEYIISLYSSFASNFDNVLLNKLDYKTPTVLRNKINNLFSNSDSRLWARGLDLGCGTGLSGAAFRDCITYLEGVDLSPEMVSKAKGRGCYDKISVEALEINLSEQKETFDIVIACDVFVYIGDLYSIIDAVRKVLTPNGVFTFSTEWLNESNKKDFKLQSTARFAHKISYIKKLSEKCGFHVLSMSIETIRKNKGEDINGILAVFQAIKC